MHIDAKDSVYVIGRNLMAEQDFLRSSFSDFLTHCIMSPYGSVTLKPIREKNEERKGTEIKMAGIKVFRFINVEPSLLGLYILGSIHRVE